MTELDPAEVAAERIDQLLAQLRSSSDPRAATAGDELTSCLVQLYGAGLTRIATMLGPERVVDLCADPLVESLLLVHDLHPVDVHERIRAALRQPRLHREDVEYMGIDEAGVVHLRTDAAGGGCSSSRQGMVAEVEAVVRRAAPEATDVVVEIPIAPPPLLQISLRPGLGGPSLSLMPAEAGP